MNKDEAVMEVHRRFNSRSRAIVHQVTKWTYEIYDDFESRKCGNCSNYIVEENGCFVVNNFVDEDFGCNRFERRSK